MCSMCAGVLWLQPDLAALVAVVMPLQWSLVVLPAWSVALLPKLQGSFKAVLLATSAQVNRQLVSGLMARLTPPALPTANTV